MDHIVLLLSTITYNQIVFAPCDKLPLRVDHPSLGVDAEAPVTPPRPDAVVNVCIGSLVTVERHHPVEGGVEGPGRHSGNPNLILQAREYRFLVIFVGYRDDDPGGGGEFRGAVVLDSDLWEKILDTCL